MGLPRVIARCLLALAVSTAAASQAAEPATALDTGAIYDIPERTPDEIDLALHSACERSQATGKRVLVEFSAPWCKDCRRLIALKRDATLADELSRWEVVEVNVRDPDPHVERLRAFGVRAIAHWTALDPKRCDAEASRWPRLGARTLESRRGWKPIGASELAAWLTAMRKSAR